MSDRFYTTTSPAAVELRRKELGRKDDMLASKSAERLAEFTLRNTKANAAPLDRTQLYTDPKVQDFTHLSGSRPTVPSSRGDAGIANLSNSLRFERRVGYTEAIPADGGRSVDPTTLVANWVEERCDRNHKHGWHKKELRMNKLWDTEHTASHSVDAAHPGYAQATISKNLVAQQPAESQEAQGLRTKGAARVGTDMLGYSREGFGPEPWQDHTSQRTRGAAHVGTAPVSGESISTTVYGKGKPLEWMKPSPSSNVVPKTDEWTLRAHADLHASQKNCASMFKTTHQRDFTNQAAGLRKVVEAELLNSSPMFH